MTEDYNCKLCGKHFADEDDYKNHGEQDHPEFNEMYGEAKCDDCGQDYDSQYVLDKHKDVAGHEEESGWRDPDTGDTVKERPNRLHTIGGKSGIGGQSVPREGDEIEQQQDKPVQSHDDWLDDLKGLKDEYSTEEDKDHPRINISYGLGADAKSVKNFDELRDIDKKDDAEEGGADDPLKKVADLAESYRFLSKDRRASLFESLGFTQGDSATLSGLEWNELTRPVKVEASEAFAKEEDAPAEKEIGEDPEVGGNEDEAYEALYNIEKNHASPDYKKKAIECSRCNEKFYNFNDRSVHFNEVHATEQEYELPDECPFCKEIIQEPETLDWHMSEQHGAHVPSQFTQTGVSAGMADTDFDALEAFDHDWACPRCGNKNVKTKYNEDGLPSGRECPKCGLGKESNTRGSYAREGVKEDIYNFIKIQGEVPAYPSMLTGLGINVSSEELMEIVDELEAEGKISAGFQDRRSQEYPNERSPWVAGATRSDFNDSGEWTWKAEAKEDFSGIFHNIHNYDCYTRCSVCGADVDRCTDDGTLTDVYLEQHYNEHEAKGQIPHFESHAKEGYGDLLQSQKRILDDYLRNNPDARGVDDLPSDVWNQVEEKKDSEFLWGAVDRYINDYTPLGESYATEYGNWWDKHTRWESGMDQDFLYCNHCGRDLYAEASWVPPLNNVGDDKMNRVVPDHLANHGITENFSGEVSYNSIKNASSNTRFENKWDGSVKSKDEVIRELEKSAFKKEDVWEQEESMNFNADFNWKRYTGESRATPGFDTNCTDGEPHEPPAEVKASGTNMMDTTCVKCGKTISQTGEGSGYWFNYPEDQINWDRAINNLDEYGNVIRESHAKEVKIPQGDLYQYGQKVGTIRDYNSSKHEGYVTLDGIGIEEFGAMTSDYEVRVNGEKVPNKWDGKHDYNLDLFGESRASDLRKEIKRKEKFINMASFENPLNMGDDEAQLADMKAELASLGETFGDYEVDCDCDKDPNCSKCKGKGTTTWTSQVGGEGWSEDLDGLEELWKQKEEKEDAEEESSFGKNYPKSGLFKTVADQKNYYEYPDNWQEPSDEAEGDDVNLDEYWDEDSKGDLIPNKKQDKMLKNITEGYHIDLDDTTEYIDDSDNSGEKYVCEDCGKEFKSDTELQEHQYSYFHGDYKDDSDGETSPRNVMGGQ